MPFSLSSYLLGVGTIVGALALGVGSGTLVTKKAVKETAAPTRVEHVARAEQAGAAAAQTTGARDDPAPRAEPAPAVRSDAVTPTEAETPKTDVRREAEGAKEPAPAKQSQPASAPESRDGVQKKTTERRVERPRQYAERRTRPTVASRTKQRPSSEWEDQRAEWQDQWGSSGSAFSREEPHFDLFRMFSPPPYERSAERDD